MWDISERDVVGVCVCKTIRQCLIFKDYWTNISCHSVIITILSWLRVFKVLWLFSPLLIIYLQDFEANIDQNNSNFSVYTQWTVTLNGIRLNEIHWLKKQLFYSSVVFMNGLRYVNIYKSLHGNLKYISLARLFIEELLT